MSFGKLLAAGRSIAGGQVVGRYRLNPGVRLPKFISPQNPFAQLPRDDAVQTVNSEAPAQNLPKQDADTVARAPSLNKLSKDEARVSAPVKILSLLARCARKLNPLGLLSGRKRKTKSAILRFSEKAVQGELSLDRVRVMRNDLMDADLEVVSPAAVRSRHKSSTGNGAWSRLAARVFDTETS
jgi:hypothetical protein